MEEFAAKLSYSGRISLTDIVKATIYNDEDFPQSPKLVINTDEDLSETEPETRSQDTPDNGLICITPLKNFAFQKNESHGIQHQGHKRFYSDSDIDNTFVNKSKKLCKETLNQSQPRAQRSLSNDGKTQSVSFSYRIDDIVNQSTQQADRKFSSYRISDIVEQSSTPITKRSDIYFSGNSSMNCSPAGDSRLNDSLSLLCSSPPDSPLSQNPFFADLQAILAMDCKKSFFPQTLLAVMSGEKREEDVFTREQNLQHRFNNLKDKCQDEILQLSSFYRYQSALIDTERFRTLHEKQFPPSFKESLVAHYDIQLHKILDRVERSMTLLEKAQMENDAINNRTTRLFKPRPLLPKQAIDIMEEWYSHNSEHPYPNPIQAEALAQVGNIGVEQVKKWMANKRNRTRNTRTLTEIAMRKRQLSIGEASPY